MGIIKHPLVRVLIWTLIYIFVTTWIAEKVINRDFPGLLQLVIIIPLATLGLYLVTILIKEIINVIRI